jgi:tetratricopeptide (TPR) repeat protein
LKQGHLLAPGNSDIVGYIGTVKKRQAHFSEASEYLERALRLDPQNPTVLGELVIVHWYQGDFAEALRFNDRAIELTGSFNAKYYRTRIYQTWRGDLVPFRTLLEETELSPMIHFRWAELLTMERNYEDAISHLIRAEKDPAIPGSNLADLKTRQARLHWLRGDQPQARRLAEEAIPLLRELDDYEMNRDINLALALAILGQPARAADQASRSLEQPLVVNDAMVQAQYLEMIAEVHIINGDLPAAVATLTRRAQYDQRFTAPWTKLNPMYDILQERSDFQELLSPHQDEDS